MLRDYNNFSISIHAPTRGATVIYFLSSKNVCISIHAPTRGATVYCTTAPCLRLFQSTLPREERLVRQLRKPTPLYFNPRSHERSDEILKVSVSYILHFNPRSHERSDSNIAQKICLFLYNTDNKYIIR